ncbi:MAG: PorT family protein [Alistipes sp.]|nr:PorT family protein [Alistipes sp.]
MKKVLLIALAVALTLGVAASAAAQRVELGVRAGVGSQSIDRLGNIVDAKSRLGWNLAAVSRIRLIGTGGKLTGVGLFLQPEVVYSRSNIRVDNGIRELVSVPATRAVLPDRYSEKVRVQTIDVPLLLSFKASILRVQAGPVFNLMSDFGSNDGLELLPLRPAVGYALGASVDLLGFTFDGRYHGSFKEMSFRGDWADVKSRFSSWSLGVGIMF